MEENYQSGDWGVGTFEFHKKGKTVRITAFGQIKEIEPKVVLFQDDCMEYIINRKKFKFEKKEAPVEK